MDKSEAFIGFLIILLVILSVAQGQAGLACMGLCISIAMGDMKLKLSMPDINIHHQKENNGR